MCEPMCEPMCESPLKRIIEKMNIEEEKISELHPHKKELIDFMKTNLFSFKFPKLDLSICDIISLKYLITDLDDTDIVNYYFQHLINCKFEKRLKLETSRLKFHRSKWIINEINNIKELDKNCILVDVANILSNAHFMSNFIMKFPQLIPYIDEGSGYMIHFSERKCVIPYLWEYFNSIYGDYKYYYIFFLQTSNEKKIEKYSNYTIISTFKDTLIDPILSSIPYDGSDDACLILSYLILPKVNFIISFDNYSEFFNFPEFELLYLPLQKPIF